MATRQRLMNLELHPFFEGKHFSTLWTLQTTYMSSPPKSFTLPIQRGFKTFHHSWVDHGGRPHANMEIRIHNHLTGVPWLKPLHQGSGIFHK